MPLVPDIPQDWWEENRDLYGAETTTSNIEFPKCMHYFERKAHNIVCTRCSLTLFDPQHEFAIIEGELMRNS